MTQLYQGDCLALMKEMPDKSVDLVITDPPYGINFVSNYRQHTYDKIENDDKLSWLDEFVDECFRVLKDNTAIYCFCSWHKIDVFKQAFQRKFKIKNIIVWEKNNTSMGDLKGSYAPKHEFCLFAHKGRRLLNGFRFPDVIKAKRTGNKYHPTEKPVDLTELFVNASSNEQEIILDPFMGSGSTGVACVNTGRNFIGMEIDGGYFEIAKKRIEEAEKAVAV